MDQSERPFRDPWPLSTWPDVPTRVLLCHDDRFFSLPFLRGLVQQRLGIEPDEMEGSHPVALSRPVELANRLEEICDDELRREFQGLLNGWAAAIVANDPDRIASFAEPGWITVDPAGGPQGLEEFLAAVRSGHLIHSNMAFEVLEARVVGDAAVVLSHSTNHGTWRGGGRPSPPTNGPPTSSPGARAVGGVRCRR